MTDGEILRRLLCRVDGERLSDREGNFLINLRDGARFWQADNPDELLEGQLEKEPRQ